MADRRNTAVSFLLIGKLIGFREIILNHSRFTLKYGPFITISSSKHLLMVIDVIFFAVFIYTFYIGFSRGIIQTVFMGISILIGFVAALRFSPYMTTFLDQALTAQGSMIPFLAFVLTFLGVMILIRMIAGLIESVLDAADLEMLNKFAGGILFSSLGILVYSGILIFFNKAHLFTEGAVSSSAFYPYLEAFPGKISEIVSRMLPFVGDMWNSTVDSMDDAKDFLDSTNAR